MAAKKLSAQFYCTECGANYQKWLGKCESCSAWNTIEEFKQSSSFSSSSSKTRLKDSITFTTLNENIKEAARYLSGIKEFDRVCGGGLVEGSAVLIGGDPGIGKSTILMQVVAKLSSSHSCVYISGEESVDQIKRRASRLNLKNNSLKISSATCIQDILYSIELLKDVQVIIIDSIQTVYSEEISAIPGSVSQVKACANEIINYCKKNNIIVIMVGHVTREGQIAGPRVLEHMVDCVLYFEGEKNNNFRILRAVKNRFGATDEIGIFEMTEYGLNEIENPSALFLHDYLANVNGTAVFSGIEGLRSLLVEVQALIVPTVFPSPKRAVVGADSNRTSMLTAVIESRSGIVFANKDIYLNIAGGLRIIEPALDLAICGALISAIMQKPLPIGTIFFGEVSLSGQIRSVSHIEKRLSESMRLGFTSAIIPKIPLKQKKLIKKDILDTIKVIEISSIKDIVSIVNNKYTS